MFLAGNCGANGCRFTKSSIPVKLVHYWEGNHMIKTKTLLSCCLALIIAGCATTAYYRSTADSELATEPGIVLDMGYSPYVAGTPSYPMAFPTVTVNVKVYRDTEELLAGYKTFNFDYTNKTNPLLEKELFQQLEKALRVKGLTRVKENPQVLISMDFFIGKREQYTPPTTVTSTELQTVWNSGFIGWDMMGSSSQVPVTSSKTTPGYTTISYYSNIRLNFLNYAKLIEKVKPTVPPLIWMGEADNEGTNPDIRGIAPTMLGELASEFPGQTGKPLTRYVRLFNYGGIGLGFDPRNWRVVRYIEPASPAAAAGIKPGDVLVKINGESTEDWSTDAAWTAINPANYRLGDPYFKYILSNRGDVDVEMVIKSGETGKWYTRKLRPRSEPRYLQVDQNGIPLQATAKTPI
jgi:hypothetical protein